MRSDIAKIRKDLDEIKIPKNKKIVHVFGDLPPDNDRVTYRRIEVREQRRPDSDYQKIEELK